MSAVDLHAEAHRLKTERGYGARRIGQELGISRHAATQLLARPLPQPVAGQERPVAELVAEVADQERPVAESVADPDGQERPEPRPVAELVAGVAAGSRPVAAGRLPVEARLVEPSGHVAGVARLFRMPGARSPWLRIDLSGRPWLVRDLMRLVRLGLQIPYVVDIAVRSFAAAYHQAVTRGDLVPGQPYEVQTRVRPCHHT